MTQIRLIGNRYEITSLIGHGGIATVYKGRNLQTGEIVAVKVLKSEVTDTSPEMVERFVREGEALRRLNHPNIVKVLDTFEDDDQHYVIMEYVSGGDLRMLMEREGLLPVARVMEIALDLSDALIRAHRLKIVHRDIKPANVLMLDDSTPRLSDFGVAHFEDSARMTQTGQMIGTLAYLSPEGISGRELDVRADIWSFGVMLYEMLAGKRPFDDSMGSAALIMSILTGPIQPLIEVRPDLPPALANLVMQMLLRDREDRVHSFRVVGAQLEAIIAGKEPPPIMKDDSGSTPARTGTTSPDISTLPTFAEAKAGPRALNPLLIIPVLLVAAALIIIVFLVTSDRASSPLVVAPVSAGELLVLVADLELVNGATENPTRFIVDDLQQKFERELQYSIMRPRAYPRVVTSVEQAAAAADANDAPLIIWGNYDGEVAELNFQLGSLDALPRSAFPRQQIENTVNIRIRFTDVRRQSLFAAVIAAANAIVTTAEDSFGVGTNLASLSLIGAQSPEIEGNTLAARWYRFVVYFVEDTPRSFEEINAAISLDRTNPLLFLGRSFALQRLGRLDEADVDLRTVQELGGTESLISRISLGQSLVMLRNQPTEALLIYDALIRLRPDDWSIRYFRGAANYMVGNYDIAREDLEWTLRFEDRRSFVYPTLAALAMREGRLLDVQQLLEASRTTYPDTAYAQRIGMAAYSVTKEQSPMIAAMAAYGDFNLLQWEEALDNLQFVLDNPYYALNDFYILEGIAHCNLENYVASEASYTALLEREPDYYLAYMMRAEVRLRQNNLVGALDDVRMVLQSEQGDIYSGFLPAVQNRELTCENVFSADLSQYLPDD